MFTRKDTYLTKEGLQEMQARLDELKTVKRREVAEAIHTAREQGDLSENAEYSNAKDEQRRIEGEIAQIEMVIKNAKVVTSVGTTQVGVGNKILLKFNGEELTYRLVGSNEADPSQYKISNEAPIGKALMGKKKGETVRIPTPAGEKECKIIDIQ